MSPRVVFINNNNGKIPLSDENFLENIIEKFTLYNKHDLVGYSEVRSVAKHIERLRGKMATEQYLMDTLKWNCYVVQTIISNMKCHISTETYDLPKNCIFKDIGVKDVITFRIENHANSEWIGDIVIC